MKIIHCADLHLDSKMSANLTKEQAKQRKQELLDTFRRMVQYAADNQVAAIILAGDMFDTKNVTKGTQNYVAGEIRNHPKITFYYLRGNHDTISFLKDLEDAPENLKRFEEEWTYFSQSDKVVISGIEFAPKNAGVYYQSLALDAGKFNIVVLHGQDMASPMEGDRWENIYLKELRGKGIDYLALGHVHEHREGALDARGRWCYAGCLEGRGFDECGEHGFMLLDIDEETGKYSAQWVHFAKRRLYEISVDVSDCVNTMEMEEAVRLQLDREKKDSSSLIKLVLTGSLVVDCERNLDYLAEKFRPEFYFLKVVDHTKFAVDYEDFRLDESLKGEFVRTVKMAEDLSEEEKATIIRYGIQALTGETIE